MMRIAVIDVAANRGGAMSVLLDFLGFIQSDDAFCKSQEWFIYTSTPLDINKNNVHNILVSKVKKSWFHRLAWEKGKVKKALEESRIDAVISLQNTAVTKGRYRQIVYFHNVLLLEKSSKYSLRKPEERQFAFYTKLVGRYTLATLKNADVVVCQTETVRHDLLDHNDCLNVQVIRPNVRFNPKHKNKADLPVSGLVYPTSAVPFKRVEELVQCVASYRDWFRTNSFEVLITISGEENEYARKIKRMCEGLSDIIKLIGFQDRDKLMKLYYAHALFVCSELESFPIPFIEAAYVGTPIIAANYPYARECIKGVNSAFLYNYGDIGQMMKKIEEASSVKVLKENSIDFADNTWDKIVPMIIG